MIISLSLASPQNLTLLQFVPLVLFVPPIIYILRCARFFKAFLLLSLSLSLSVFLRIRVRIRSGREKENLDRRRTKKTASGVLHCLGCSYFLSKKKKSSQFVRTKRHLTLCARLWNVRKNHDDFTIKRYKEEGTALLLSLSL